MYVGEISCFDVLINISFAQSLQHKCRQQPQHSRTKEATLA